MKRIVLTTQQKAAIGVLSYNFGNEWKTVLRTAWKTGDFRKIPSEQHAVLRQLQTSLGPSGLDAIRTADFARG